MWMGGPLWSPAVAPCLAWTSRSPLTGLPTHGRPQEPQPYPTPLPPLRETHRPDWYSAPCGNPVPATGEFTSRERQEPGFSSATCPPCGPSWVVPRQEPTTTQLSPKGTASKTRTSWSLNPSSTSALSSKSTPGAELGGRGLLPRDHPGWA